MPLWSQKSPHSHIRCLQRAPATRPQTFPLVRGTSASRAYGPNRVDPPHVMEVMGRVMEFVWMMPDIASNKTCTGLSACAELLYLMFSWASYYKEAFGIKCEILSWQSRGHHIVRRRHLTVWSKSWDRGSPACPGKRYLCTSVSPYAI